MRRSTPSIWVALLLSMAALSSCRLRAADYPNQCVNPGTGQVSLKFRDLCPPGTMECGPGARVTGIPGHRAIGFCCD